MALTLVRSIPEYVLKVESCPVDEFLERLFAGTLLA